MDNSKLSYYKKLLIAEKNELEAEIGSLSDERRESVKESTGELSSYDNHPADQASNTFGRELDRGVSENTLRLLLQVNNALERIDEGTYGVCQRCGREIKSERLAVVPETEFCEKCQEIEEIEDNRRPSLSEGDAYASFDWVFNDGSDKVEYDGEDSWQDVAQYGTSSTPQDVPETLTGGNTGEQAYIDSDEIIGSVTRVDSLMTDKADNPEDTEETETDFTGSMGENHRQK